MEAAAKLLVADTQQLDCFKEIIAEPAIEFLFDSCDFFGRLLRKGSGEILTHNAPAVLDDVEHHEVLESEMQ